MVLRTEGKWFVDDQGSKILLRGVNLGGSTKVPVDPDGATHIDTDFSKHRDVSFVGRPFPLDEADEHFRRLKHWGFNCLRLLTTWEAIEHKGPGKYDQEYLDYFTKIVEMAGDYGFYVFIDPHQDVWSRMTGGDGAPGWTFEKVGIDFTTFKDNDTAKVMQYHYPENYEQMEWFMNYNRFATATMFTLFFGGEQFAPNVTIEGQSVQSYLQSHFIESMEQIAHRIKDFEHVIGFDSLNEPHQGYIGIEDLGKNYEVSAPGLNFSPFDMLAVGSGYSRKTKIIKLHLLWLRETGTKVLNLPGISCWKSSDHDIWMDHGIFEEVNNEAKLLQPNYFKYNEDGSRVDFFDDYLRPFAIDYINQMREIIPDSLLFLEGEPQDPKIIWHDTDPKGIVNASHWYDGYTLFTKSYRSWFNVNIDTRKPIFFGSRITNYYREQMQKRINQSIKIGNIPTLIGEFGIPFDMNNGKAYETGIFDSQIQALNKYYNVIDELKLHSTLWNYTSDNINKWGDLWNMEDLSIFSRDQQENQDDINSGGRAIAGFCRPYPQKINAKSVTWEFDLSSKTFSSQLIGAEGHNIFYIPNFHFNNINIEISPEIDYDYNPGSQLLEFTVGQPTEVNIQIRNSK